MFCSGESHYEKSHNGLTLTSMHGTALAELCILWLLSNVTIIPDWDGHSVNLLTGYVIFQWRYNVSAFHMFLAVEQTRYSLLPVHWCVDHVAGFIAFGGYML